MRSMAGRRWCRVEMNARKVDPCGCGQGGTRPAANNAAEQGRACGGASAEQNFVLPWTALHLRCFMTKCPWWPQNRDSRRTNSKTSCKRTNLSRTMLAAVGEDTHPDYFHGIHPDYSNPIIFDPLVLYIFFHCLCLVNPVRSPLSTYQFWSWTAESWSSLSAPCTAPIATGPWQTWRCVPPLMKQPSRPPWLGPLLCRRECGEVSLGNPVIHPWNPKWHQNKIGSAL
jgi:hypothetical protein